LFGSGCDLRGFFGPAGREMPARTNADRGVPRATRTNQVRIRNRIERRKPRRVSVFCLRFLPDLGEMGEIRNSKFEIRKVFQKFRTKSTKQNLKFGPKNGRNLNEKWPKFEQIL
jgi:hypothetical protein